MGHATFDDAVTIVRELIAEHATAWGPDAHAAAAAIEKSLASSQSRHRSAESPGFEVERCPHLAGARAGDEVVLIDDGELAAARLVIVVGDQVEVDLVDARVRRLVDADTVFATRAEAEANLAWRIASDSVTETQRDVAFAAANLYGELHALLARVAEWRAAEAAFDAASGPMLRIGRGVKAPSDASESGEASISDDDAT